MDIYLNGQMIPHDQAQISVHDAAFQHAVGLFETMIARNGQVFRLDQHLSRLAQSAEILGLALTVDTEQLASAVAQTLEHNKLDEARVRLTVTPGPISLLKAEDSSTGPTVLVVADQPTQYDPDYFESGILVVVGAACANPFDPLAGHKTLAYWGRLSTLRDAAALGAGEVILLNITHHLASGAVSNLFLVKDGVLLTPIARGEEVQGSLPAPVLPGITRQVVIELAQSQGVTVEQRMLSVDDLLNADEVFLTNSGWQLLPVTRVEKKKVGDQKVGPVSMKLRQALLEKIESETK